MSADDEAPGPASGAEIVERELPTPDGSPGGSSARTRGIDGVPAQYNDGLSWLDNGLERHIIPSVVALFVGWTGIWLALWGAVLGAFLGLLVAVGVTAIHAPFFDQIGLGQAVTIVSVVTGLGLGAVGGFVAIASFIVTNPISLLGSLFGGAIISLIIVVTIACFERLGLRLRGYRRLSRDEVRKIAVPVKEACYVLGLPALPRFAIEDAKVPNAWTHMRTIVMTTGLLDALSEGELRAVMAHELAHWHKGDAVGLRFVWAASLPAVLLYNLGTLISGRWPSKDGEAPPSTPGGGLLALIGWFVAWPAWVLTKWVVVPLTAKHQRQYEYEADAAVRAAGFGTDLASALKKLSAFEAGRTGWERAMTATHPPTILRIEALQPQQPDDWDYQEDELRGPRWKEIRRIVIGEKLPKRITVPQSST